MFGYLFFGQIDTFDWKSCLGRNKMLGQNFLWDWDCKFFGLKRFLIRDQGICEITRSGCSPLENCRVNALIDLKSNSVYH